jgi:hypothetical protein
MRRTVRLTESDLARIVKRVIREQVDLPTCNSKMVNNGSPGSSSEMSGSFTKITFNGTVSPESQGYTVHTANGPFCFVPIGGTPRPPQTVDIPLPPRPPLPPPRTVNRLPAPNPNPPPRPLD